MGIDADKLDLLWKCVEDARIQWKSAHNNIKEISDVTVSIPSPDGNFARAQAFRAENLAAKRYLQTLEDFKAVLHPQEEPVVEIANGDSRRELISPRELEVLKLIASGKSSREIAALLGIAFKTAVVHRHNIHQKLKVHKAADLIRTAMRIGLIEP